MPQKHVYHQSEIADYLKCGIYHQYKFLEGRRAPLKSAATVGLACDGGINHALITKIEGEEASLEEIRDVTATVFDELTPETDWDEPEDLMKDTAIRIVEVFMEQVAPTLSPAGVQVPFQVELEKPYDIGGTIDLIETTGRIHDLKTASPGRVKSHQVNLSLQPAMYTFAASAVYGEPFTEFQFNIITRKVGSSPKYTPTLGTVTARDHEILFDTIDRVHHAIQSGVAVPAPEGSWICTRKWCPFWDICKGRRS